MYICIYILVCMCVCVCVCVCVDLHFVGKIEGGGNSALVRKRTGTFSKKLIRQ